MGSERFVLTHTCFPSSSLLRTKRVFYAIVYNQARESKGRKDHMSKTLSYYQKSVINRSVLFFSAASAICVLVAFGANCISNQIKDTSSSIFVLIVLLIVGFMLSSLALTLIWRAICISCLEGKEESKTIKCVKNARALVYSLSKY